MIKNDLKGFFYFFLFLFFTPDMPAQSQDSSFMIFGHRGARAYYPENTILGFIQAVKNGVTALELDVVVTKDSQVVVSHEPWFSHLICKDPGGENVKRAHQGNIFKMNYTDVKNYDCGTRGNPNFPGQEKMAANKPLLKDLIAEVEKYCSVHDLAKPTWLIEIKSRKISDNKFHPGPERFVQLVNAVILSFNINERIIIQSFDQRPLKEFHRLDPELKIGLLVLRAGNMDHKIRKLGFIPYCYNPSHKIIRKKTIAEAHHLNMKVFVWTVNEPAEIKKLRSLGADGIISDQPY